MTDRLTKGDRVIVVSPDGPARGQTGTIAEDDKSSMPYFVRLDDTGLGTDYDWYRESDVAPAAYRPIAPGEHVPEGADVFIPAWLVSRHGETDGERGPVKTFAAIDDDGDLPVKMKDGVMMWFRATDCYINTPAREAVSADDEAEETPAEGQPIRVLRRHVIVLEQPVSPDDLARAARALEPGMHVSVHTYTDRMEVVGTDPEGDRG